MPQDQAGDDKLLSRRRFLQLAGGGVASHLMDMGGLPVKILSPSLHADDHRLIAKAVESFLDSYVRDAAKRTVTLTLNGKDRHQYRLSAQDDILRAFSRSYRKTCLSPEWDEQVPFIESYEDAMAFADRYLADMTEQDRHMWSKYVIGLQRPDLMTAIHAELERHPECVAYAEKLPKFFETRWATFQQSLDRSSLGQIEGLIEQQRKYWLSQVNAMTFQRFGRSLPHVPHAEAEALERHAVANAKEALTFRCPVMPNCRSLSPVTVTRQEEEIPCKRYLLTLAAEPPLSRAEDAEAMKELIAAFNEQFPCKTLLLSDGSDLQLDLAMDRKQALLIPTRAGLTVMVAADAAHPRLRIMDELLTSLYQEQRAQSGAAPGR